MLKRASLVPCFVLCSLIASLASTDSVATDRSYHADDKLLNSSSLAVLVVNTTADESDGSCVDADCSLRDAISLAASGDTIMFSALFNTPQTISLTLGTLPVDQQLTITGPGANLLTLLDNNALPGSTFTIAAASDVSISGLTITGANANGSGGAITSLNSTLRLESVHITGNTSTFSIAGVSASGGSTYIVNSTFSNNTAPMGSCAAFSQSGGDAYIANSTFSGNSSNSDTGFGGAICAEASLWLRNVTIVGNSSGRGGGVYYSEGLGGAQLHIANSIIAGNSALAPGAGGREICLGTTQNVTSEGNNLVGDSPDDAGGCDVFDFQYLPSDILNTNPLLGPLQNNGGPTPTHALLSGSPAIDAGSNAQAIVPGPSPVALTTDQRGAIRIVDGNSDGTATVDIGAFEVQAAPSAAYVTVSGRVQTASGMGVRNALLTVSGGDLESPIIAQTGSFGEFMIEGLTAGRTYIIAASAPRYTIDQPVRDLTVYDDVTGFNFTASR